MFATQPWETAEPAKRGDVVDDIRKAIKFIFDHPYDNVCGTAARPHVVHPKAVGWAICGNCFGPVFVESALA